MKRKRSKQEIQPPKHLAKTIEKIPPPVPEMKRSLRKIEAEVTKLKRLTQGIPGVEKNITPIMSFIDILKFHLNDLEEKE